MSKSLLFRWFITKLLCLTLLAVPFSTVLVGCGGGSSGQGTEDLRSEEEQDADEAEEDAEDDAEEEEEEDDDEDEE